MGHGVGRPAGAVLEDNENPARSRIISEVTADNVNDTVVADGFWTVPLSVEGRATGVLKIGFAAARDFAARFRETVQLHEQITTYARQQVIPAQRCVICNLIDELETHYGITDGGTTADGELTVQVVKDLFSRDEDTGKHGSGPG